MTAFTRLALLLLAAFAMASYARITTVTEVSGGSFVGRSWDVDFSPNAASPAAISVTGGRLDVDNPDVGDGNLSGDLTALRFEFKNPNYSDNVLSVYAASFAAEGEITDVFSSSYEASLVQLAAQFYFMFPWENNDGAPGFQYTLGDNSWDCDTNSGSVDCMPNVQTYGVQLKDEAWNPWTYETSSCGDDCTFYSLTTSTVAEEPVGSGNPIFVLTVYYASQEVDASGSGFAGTITPDEAKIDLTLNYPWSRFPELDSNDWNIGVAAAAAGFNSKATGGAEITDNGNSRTFESENLAGYFEWVSNADVTTAAGTTSKPVYTSSVTGQQFRDFQCTLTTCGVAEFFIITAYQIVFGVFEAFGWKAQLVFFSWEQTGVTEIFWDPKLGVSAETTSAVASLSPSLLAVAAVVSLVMYLGQ